MFDRFHSAFQTELGTVYLVLVVLLIVLSGIYLYLMMRQKEQDQLRYQFNTYYNDAENVAKKYRFDDRHLAEFFGRETIVFNEKRQPFVCLIPPPALATEEIRSRYDAFQRAISRDNDPVFAKYDWVSTNYPFILVQDNLLQGDGRRLLSVNKYLKSANITETDKEKVLFELSRSLAKLHQRFSDIGDRLYHGFLIPRFLYVDVDESHALKKIVVANLGLAYALGPELIQKRLMELKTGKLTIDRWAKNDLIDQMYLLAPEQLSKDHLVEVSTPCDFYSFAALAVSIFTGEKFKGVEKVDWASVPDKWVPFLQSCLHKTAANRPKDFNELEEWLSDPELGLTHCGSEVVHHDWKKADLKQDLTFEGNEGFDVEAIKSLSCKNEKEDLVNDGDPFVKSYTAGCRAAKAGKWKEACDYLKEAVTLNDENLEAKVQLAISFYEIGDIENAESTYKDVKEKDPEAAKQFRRHIAFKM